jgi:hypothetical protein
MIYFQTLSGNHNRGFYSFMNVIKKTALTLSIALSLAATTSIAFAEEATAPAVAAAPKAVATGAELIAHLEQAIVLMNGSDFSNANLAIRAARSGIETMGDSSTLNQADAIIQRGQVANKTGEIEKGTAALKEGIQLIKSL